MPTTPVIQTILIFFALLFPGAQSAFAAEQHTLMVRISNSQAAYTQTVSIAEDRLFNHVGPVNNKQMLINGLLTRDNGIQGLLLLQYQLELSGGPGSQGRAIQVQNEVAIRPGDHLTTLECGPWTVKLALDAKGAEEKKSRGAAWSPAGLPNYRLTTKVSGGGSVQLCKLISRAGVQSGVTDSIQQGTRKYGFIINSLFTPADDGQGFSLHYQLEHGLNGAAKPLQIQGNETLTINKKTAIPGRGYRLEFILEGKKPAKQATPKEGARGDSKNEYDREIIICREF